MIVIEEESSNNEKNTRRSSNGGGGGGGGGGVGGSGNDDVVVVNKSYDKEREEEKKQHPDDYYKRGSTELATETALTLDRLEAVRGICTYVVLLHEWRVYWKSWMKTTVVCRRFYDEKIFPSSFSSRFFLHHTCHRCRHIPSVVQNWMPTYSNVQCFSHVLFDLPSSCSLSLSLSLYCEFV